MVQDFKDSNDYSDELCKYYVEGIDLLMKWMAKHHLGLDLSGLVVDEVEKKLMFDHPSEATDVAEGMKEATIVAPVHPVPGEQ